MKDFEPEVKELVKQLKVAIKDDDNEAAHGCYDNILIFIAEKREPRLLKRINKLVGDMDFWYA